MVFLFFSIVGVLSFVTARETTGTSNCSVCAGLQNPYFENWASVWFFVLTVTTDIRLKLLRTGLQEEYIKTHIRFGHPKQT
ncbi:hypothetical protein L1987_63858 [Smallanthus sonchifolius]|uniref:Uncharacterized protein n=1 Tax=Smallanthus sonchifolius TaxID=185202 RepID=A0ACB9CEG0_9ASTR|nr:hypothetical protein L1987_63858 [Smallanthus sonchifolius]